MSGLRTVHAIAILAIVPIMLAWSLETLRVAIQSRWETR